MKDLLVRFARKTKSIVKRGQPLALVAGLLAGIVASSLPVGVATAAPVQNLTPSPRLSFTFDDGFVSSLEKAAPTLAAHELTGTNYVITECVGMVAPNDCAADGTRNYMSWDQIRDLQNTYDWEIGSHTVSHPLLSTLTTSQIEAELVNSRQALTSNGVNATNIAFPYGDYNTEVLAQAAKYYDSARGFADTDAMNGWPYNANLLYDQQVQAGAPAPVWSLCTDMTVAGVKACIDQAITNNQWLILTFHDILDAPNTSADSYDYSTADLDAIAAYAKAKQDANALKVVNIDDGLVRGTNLLTNGDFNSGLDGWTTDAAANITADSANNGRYPNPTNSVSLTANASTDSHLFSPKVAVTYGSKYLLKNYLNMLNGGSVYFFVDEYDASGTKLGGYDPNTSRTFSTEENPINAGEVSFTYSPTSAAVTHASLQVIVRAGSNVQAYLDGAQWYNTGETIVTPPSDTTPPTIGGVVATGITTTSATISWGTLTELTTGAVNYGLTQDFGSTVTVSQADSQHSVALTGLAPGTTYYFQVVASDAAGNTASTTAGSYAFTTLPENGQDVTGPVITNVDVTMVGNTGVWITWNTDEVATSRIDYGTTTAYGQFAENLLTGTTPWFNLTGLTPNQTYYFQLTSTDLAGNVTTFVGGFSTNVELTPGDINGDGAVNLNDLSILSSNWGSESATRAQGDLNGDGKVNLNDLSILSSNWSEK